MTRQFRKRSPAIIGKGSTSLRGESDLLIWSSSCNKFEFRSPSFDPNITRTADPGEETGCRESTKTETLLEESSPRFTVSLFRTPSNPRVHSTGYLGLPKESRRIRHSRQMLR